MIRQSCSLLFVVVLATACSAEPGNNPGSAKQAAVEGASLAPVGVLQFLVKQTGRPALPVAAIVTAEEDGVRLQFLLCPPDAPRCESRTEHAPGILSVRHGRYTLHAETASWDLAITGTGVKALTPVHRCSYPANGGYVEIASTDYDRIQWTGTVNGERLDPLACNFFLRTGSARLSTTGNP